MKKRCVACGGKGRASNGFQCHPCKGTGNKKKTPKVFEAWARKYPRKKYNS